MVHHQILISILEIFKVLELLNLNEEAMQLLKFLEGISELESYLENIILIYFDNYLLSYSSNDINNFFKNLIKKILTTIYNKNKLKYYIFFYKTAIQNNFYFKRKLSGYLHYRDSLLRFYIQCDICIFVDT